MASAFRMNCRRQLLTRYKGNCTEFIPKDGGEVKEHDGSVGEEWTSFEGPFPVDDRAFEFMPSANIQ